MLVDRQKYVWEVKPKIPEWKTEKSMEHLLRLQERLAMKTANRAFNEI